MEMTDNEFNALIEKTWQEGYDAAKKETELQNGVANEMLSGAMEILTKIVDSEKYPIAVRCDAKELLRRWQRGEHLKQAEKRVDEVQVCGSCGWRNDGSRVMHTAGKVVTCGNCFPTTR